MGPHKAQLQPELVTLGVWGEQRGSDVPSNRQRSTVLGRAPQSSKHTLSGLNKGRQEPVSLEKVKSPQQQETLDLFLRPVFAAGVILPRRRVTGEAAEAQ